MLKTKVEWCDSSFNPLVGCLHGCNYCYARTIASHFKGCDSPEIRKTESGIIYLKEPLYKAGRDGIRRKAPYPFGFTPTFYEYRLDDLKKRKYGKTVFVCSTADLFGGWVPEEWIIKVFDACKEATEHRFLFLTKNPQRYVELASKGVLPERDNFWYGTTVTDPDKEAFWAKDYHTFVSVEPVLKPFGDAEPDEYGRITADYIDWMILGAETGNKKGKVVPERSWVEGIVNEFKKRGKPVFMKDSMIPIWGEDILTEFPWEEKM